MYPPALHKISTQTIDSSKVLEGIITQKPPNINKTKKGWDRNTSKDLEHLCPKQVHDILFGTLSWKTILPRIKLSS